MAFDKNSLNQPWRGLGSNLPNLQSNTLIDDSPTDWYYYSAIGAFTYWPRKGTIPGSRLPDPGRSSPITKVELYVFLPTGAPTTEASTTEASTTEAPKTEAQTTAASTTEAPTTKAPTTEAQTTVAPTGKKITTRKGWCLRTGGGQVLMFKIAVNEDIVIIIIIMEFLFSQ